MLSQINFSLLARAVILSASIALAGCSSTASSSSTGPDSSLSDKTEEAKKIDTNAKTESKKDKEPVQRVSFLVRDQGHVTRSGEVYLMRGLLNVFSRGMDTLAGRMRARGFDAVSYNHGDWQKYADDIIARSKIGKVSYPIIIMGHSLGGNASPQMANYLAAHGIETKLIVAFDPTEHQVVGKGIGDVVNYYLPNGRNTFSRGSGFSGSLKNITVTHIPDIKHVNVEKNTKLQNQSIDHAMRITKKMRSSAIAKNRKKFVVSG